MKRSALVMCALLLAGCSSAPKYERGPDVDWSGVTSAQQQAIREAAVSGDCIRLERYYDDYTSPDVLYYLDWAMKKAGC